MNCEIDEQDQWLLDNYTWYLNSGYLAHDFQGVVARLHHCIIGMPVDANIVIDHIDRNKLNNRRANLRWVTKSENYLNSERSDKATYIYRQTWSGRYYVDITRQRQRYYGGTFDTFSEAVAARDALLESIRKIQHTE